MNSANARIIYHDRFDGSGFTNETTLSKAMLTKPDKINPVVTHLAGRDNKKFPLTFLTEGQVGGMKRIEIQDIEYEWDTINRLRKSDSIVSSTYGASSKPGLNGTPIIVRYESDWLKTQHLIVSPHGYVCRIQSKPRPVGNGNYEYKLVYNTTSRTAYIPYTEFLAGVRWSMEGGAPVSQSYSLGNASNKVTPGKMKNQISILRKSMEWGGNVGTYKVAEVQLPTETGSTSYWMPFERWQHTMDMKQANEEHLWWAEYNRLPDGSFMMTDEDSNLPVPIGAGLIDQIPNQDTYGRLTARKLKNTVGDIFYGMTDTVKMDVVLYTGLGGAEEFDTAMKNEIGNFTQIVGDKFITGAGRNLRLGGFFTQYEHVDGHVITVKILDLLDHGARAENSVRHPKTGKPMTSYEMFFIDQTTYDGVRNVQMVAQKGRSLVTGYLKGMAITPIDFAGNDSEMIATEQDKSQLHFLSTLGVVLNRNTTSFRLSCDL